MQCYIEGRGWSVLNVTKLYEQYQLWILVVLD